MTSIFRQQFGTTVTVVVDCFEIAIQSSGNPEAACQIYSNYKAGPTLVGITPQGFIMFNSVAYGGRSSDKFVTEDSGFLDNISEGDVVMADRGFLILKSLQQRGGTLHISAFTRGKKQLHPLDLESIRHISHLRIHVERIINLYRQKYTVQQKKNWKCLYFRKL